MTPFQKAALLSLADSWNREAKEAGRARADQLSMCATQLRAAVASITDDLELPDGDVLPD